MVFPEPGPGEVAAVKRAAALTLIDMEERAPGTLAAAGGTREQLAAVLEATTREQG